MQSNPDLVELADNWTGPMAGRACCVAAAGEKLWRDNPLAASGLVLALNEASEYAAANPQKTAEIYSKYNPTYSLADLQGAGRELDFHSHHFPLLSLRDNIVQYAIEFQAVGALPPELEIQSFVERSYAQVKTHA
jgi:NitT/TauT family transport system substrate-binding protein